MSKHTRVYHPTLNSWQDVPAASVEGWKAAGWAVKNPGHVDDSAALPPAAPFVASVPVDPQPAQAPVVEAKATPEK